MIVVVLQLSVFEPRFPGMNTMMGMVPLMILKSHGLWYQLIVMITESANVI